MAIATITDLFNKVNDDTQVVAADEQKLAADRQTLTVDNKDLYAAVSQYGKPVIVPDPKATTPHDVIILSVADSGTVTLTPALLGDTLLPTVPAPSTPTPPGS